MILYLCNSVDERSDDHDLRIAMVCFDRLLQVTSQFNCADCDSCTVSSSASDVVLLNTVVIVIRDVAMLQMFMHVYVVANCTTVASL